MSEPNFITDKELLELISANFRFDKEKFWEQLSLQDMLPPVADNCKAITRVARIENQLSAGDSLWLKAVVLDDGDEQRGLRTGLRVQIGDYWNVTLRGNELVHLGEQRCWAVKLADREYFRSFAENMTANLATKARAYRFVSKERAQAVALLVGGELEEL